MENKKSKVVLVNPPFMYSKESFNFPYGIFYLGTFLDHEGIPVKLIDGAIEPDYREMLKEEAEEALIVGFSAMTAQVPEALALSQMVRNNYPQVKIIWGGVHSTLFPQQTAVNSYVDYAVQGEGELALLNLVKSLRDGREENIKNIGGVCFTDEADHYFENKDKEILDFNNFPDLNYDLINQEVLKIPLKQGGFPLLTTRGCPYKCAFCINVVIEENRKWRYWDEKKVIHEVKRVLDKGYKNIVFFDEFTTKPRLEKLLDDIEKEGLNFEWMASGIRADYFREDYLSLDFLKRMNRNGCTRVAIGVESGSPHILEYIEKGIKAENSLQMASYCKESGIRPSCSLMIGLPPETKDDIFATVKLMKELADRMDKFGINGPQIFRPYPHGKIYDDCLKAGLKEPETLEDWDYFMKKWHFRADARKLPWVKEPLLVNLIHFYSFLIPLSTKRLLRMVDEYVQMTGRGILFKIVAKIGITILSLMGKLRYRSGFYRLLLEKKFFDRIRGQHLSY